MPNPAPAKEEVTTEAFHNGEKFHLKANGLPVGYGLYWTYPQGKDMKPHIYTKIDGVGLSCGAEGQWKKAVDFVKLKRAELAKREHDLKPTNLTIQHLLEHYADYLERLNEGRGDYKPLTAQITRSTVNSRLKFFAGIKADKLTRMPEKMTEYRAKRTAELMAKMRKPAAQVQLTIDHELSILRSAYKRAVKDHLIHVSIVPVFDIDKKNTRIGTRHNMFTAEQAETIAKMLPEPINLMLPFCLLNGVRKKESTFIRRENMDLIERIAKLNAEETKSHKERLVPFSQKMLPALQAWEEKTKREHKHARFFFHRDGKRLTTVEIDDSFNRVCEDLGWHTPKLDEDGNKMLGKNGVVLYNRSPRWHDSRRNASTESGALEGLNDLDRQRVHGQNAETQDRYDQTQSAKKMRDAIDRKQAKIVGPAPSIAVATVLAPKTDPLEDKLMRLKGLFDRGLIPQNIYEQKQMQILADLS